jgi:hypothetical protein
MGMGKRKGARRGFPNTFTFSELILC